jgi:chromate transporter
MEKTFINSKIIVPTFAQALAYWWRLGWLSFGGPAGQIALMQHDLVNEKRWLDEKSFLHALQYCLLLPGPEAQQLATYLGWRLHGVLGGLAAGILFILPAFFLLTLLAWLYLTFAELPATEGILYGIQPAVIALIVFAVWRLGKKVLRESWLWLIALATFLGIFLLPFPLLLISAATIGLLKHWQNNKHFNASAGKKAKVVKEKIRAFPWLKILSWSFGLWLLLFAVTWFLGSFFMTMAWFFTTAALFTFGGAYAVLPYVFQAAVYHYQWLSPQQMMDALAFGESTPGPLIMVLTFIAFIGGWQASGSLGLAPWQGGLMAAIVATVFTFSPSFVFIFFGAPFIEKSKEIKALQQPMTAISAAVVGMIAYLGLFLAKTVFWQTTIDLLAIVFSVLAFVFLIKKVDILLVLLFFASLGLFVTLK